MVYCRRNIYACSARRRKGRLPIRGKYVLPVLAALCLLTGCGTERPEAASWAPAEEERLAVLSALLTGEKNFRELKGITEATDGNLGAQLKKLEEAGYIAIRKAFVNNKPQTTCTLTEFGRRQFQEYVEMLERLLWQAEEPPAL